MISGMMNFDHQDFDGLDLPSSVSLGSLANRNAERVKTGGACDLSLSATGLP